MGYGDEHRIFLQGILNSGILLASDAQELLRKAYFKSGSSLPDDSKNLNAVLRSVINVINRELNDLNLAIVEAIDEDKIKKVTHFVLVNQLDRSEEATSLTKKAMIDFAPHELEFLKVLIKDIIKGSDDFDDNDEQEAEVRGQLSRTRALNLGSKLITKALKPLETQELVERLILKNWLREGENKSICLSTRFIAEMEPYLRSVFSEDLNSCCMCNKIVLKTVECVCERHFHLHCLGSSVTKKDDPSDTSVIPCPKCKSPIEWKKMPRAEVRRKRNQDSSFVFSEEEG